MSDKFILLESLFIDSFLIWFFIIYYILFIAIVFVWFKLPTLFFLKQVYSAEQRVHEGEIPRIGGVCFYSFLILISFFFEINSFQSNFQFILICLLPMMLVSITEDIFYNNISYKVRLIGLTISALALIIFINTSLPVVNHLYIISDLFSYSSFSIIFFTLCLLALANGCNFIDGMNGLLSFYLLGAILSFLHLDFLIGGDLSSSPLIIYAILIFIFLSLNFPWGKVFMGDSGAYLMAMLLGLWSIEFFGQNESISSWNAFLIFFYPAAEVIYSFTRKILQKKSPFYPDREHLHLKIYDTINIALNRPKLSNNLTTIFLATFWIAPPLVIPLVYDNQILLFAAISLLILSYVVLNLIIPPVKRI
jgi:UDP-N-acetylmuramyl pentapeptide phosphotransferase/UDP-N-acetylglucosamine-1-phosphate transferase